MNWNETEDKFLKASRAKGSTYQEIASHLRRTNDACRTRMKILRRAKREGKSINTISQPILNSPAYSRTNELWEAAELRLLWEMRKAGLPYNIIAIEMHRSPDSLAMQYNTTDWESIIDLTDAEAINGASYIQKKEELRQRILRAADLRYERHKLGVDVLADRIESSIKALPEIAPPVWNPNRLNNKKQYKEEDVMLILSDIHIGAEHSLEETGGISSFNRELLHRRLNNLQYAVRDITELHSQLYNLPHLHVACLGDVVAGDNSSGEWSQNYISMPIVDQIVEGFDRLKNMLAYWLSIFPAITFYGVRGNHGRCGQKGVEKDYSNYDYLCYRFLQSEFRNNPRIKFVVPKTWWILQEIRGWKFLMVHGDDIKAGTFPIKRLQDFELKMTGIIKEIPDYTIAGHYHTSAELTTNHGCVIMNGSVIGGDVYSIKTVHSNSKPEQTIFGINDSRGKTWKYNIDLDDDRAID